MITIREVSEVRAGNILHLYSIVNINEINVGYLSIQHRLFASNIIPYNSGFHLVGTKDSFADTCLSTNMFSFCL